MTTNVPAPIAPGPAVHGFAVTPSDSTVFAEPTRQVYVGSAGSLTVLMNDDATTTAFAAVPAGTSLNISVTKVMATGTSATSIVGLY
jgi:hypothetical protein